MIATLTIIKTFIGANWKVLGLIVVAVFAYWKITGWLENYNETMEAKAATITKVTLARDRALIQLAHINATLQEKERHEERLELLLKDALQRQDDIRDEAQAAREAFEGHDLTKMANRYNKWMEKIVNNGTQERLDSIEDAFNN
jgi:hypothetical protein